MGILFLDLDNFKVVNDSYGYAVGDEFIILLPKLSAEIQVIATAEKIVRKLAIAFNIASHILQIGARVGIVLYPKHDNDPYNLIKYAGSPMYSAKRQGRNCYSIYHGDISELTD